MNAAAAQSPTVCESRPYWAPNHLWHNRGLTQRSHKLAWEARGFDEIPEPIEVVIVTSGDDIGWWFAFACGVVVWWHGEAFDWRWFNHAPILDDDDDDDENQGNDAMNPWWEDAMSDETEAGTDGAEVGTETETTNKRPPKVTERYIKRVQSSIGGEVDQEYGRFTLFYGPTAAGKTMLTRAIEHLAGGGASDVQWRRWSKGTSLAWLTPDGSMPVSMGTLVVGKDETEIDSASPPSSVVLSFHEIRETLTGSADKARAFISGHINTTEEAVYAALGPKLQAAYSEQAEAAGPQETVLATLLAVRDSADKAMREANAYVKTLQSSLATAQEATVTPADVKAHRQAVEEAAAALRTAREDARALQGKQTEASMAAWRSAAQFDAEWTALSQRANELRATITETEEGIERDTATLDALKAMRARDETRREALEAEKAALPAAPVHAETFELLRALSAKHLERDAKICALCRTPHDNMGEIAGKLIQQANMYLAAADERKTVLGHLQRDIQRVEDEIRMADETIPPANRRLVQVTANLSKQRADLEALYAKGREMKARRASTTTDEAPEAPPQDAAVTAAQEAYAAAKAALAAAEATLAANVPIADLRRQEEIAEERAALMKRLKAKAGKAYDQLAGEALGSFAERVNRYLPDDGGLRFGFTLDPFRWGILREGPDGEDVIHSAQSGGEGVMILTALCCAIAEDHPDKLVLVVPEERGISPKILASFMRSIQSQAPNNVQVVMTNIVKPYGRAPAGWSVVEVGEE